LDYFLEHIAFIGLGSNKGDRLKYLKSAIDKLKSLNKVRLVNISSIYETKPFGIIKQNDFYNAAIKIETSLTAIELFTELKKTEIELGRTFMEKWGPREIDIDLLLFDDLVFSNDFISLPHKGIIYRDFALQPLVEIDPELIHPELNKKLSVILSEISERFIIKKISEKLFIAG
jgi:2-amino-4-hydroxy-6-hydroxymethyldihydropteridine diphosphokinase